MQEEKIPEPDPKEKKKPAEKHPPITTRYGKVVYTRKTHYHDAWSWYKIWNSKKELFEKEVIEDENLLTGGLLLIIRDEINGIIEEFFRKKKKDPGWFDVFMAGVVQVFGLKRIDITKKRKLTDIIGKYAKVELEKDEVEKKKDLASEKES